MSNFFDEIESISSDLDLNDGGKKGFDGIYRPDTSKVSQKGQNYMAKLRFLPNYEGDSKQANSFLHKHVHYVKLKDVQTYNGYYDCQKDVDGRKCPLCDLYFQFYNATDASQKAKCDFIKRSKKIYSYVLILEDKQQPDLVGKVLIFPFGVKIFDKIKAEANGQNADGTTCNVSSVLDGKDFLLSVKELGGFPNYDDSRFADTATPMPYFNSEGKMVRIPTFELNDRTHIGFSPDTKDRDAKMDKLKSIMMNLFNSAPVKLNSYIAQEWTPEQHTNIELVKRILTQTGGKDYAYTSENDVFASKVSTKVDDPFQSEDDPFDTKPAKPAQKAKTPVAAAASAAVEDDFDEMFS